jgi:hypothetical protein
MKVWPWITGSHGELAGGDTTNKEDLHLMVVQDCLVEELGILGVILKKKNNKDY